MENAIKYPVEFTERMKKVLGAEYDAFIQSLNGSSPTSVRLNPNKSIHWYDKNEKVPWCELGRYLAERPSFTFDPLFHAGTYYVQEASSMFLEEVWQHINSADERIRVLDMCAAPGGKSTHLLSLMNAESLLVSNEMIATRNRVLQQNIIKWGNANCVIVQNKPEDFSRIKSFFDIVLIDAPCSGEGLFRKDKNAIEEWSEKNVEMCSVRQKEILQHALECLKPGGFLIYSTCTYEPVENDDNIQWAIEQGLSHISLDLKDKYPGIVNTKYGYQFFPHKIKGEGFYMALLQKKGGPIGSPRAPHLNPKPGNAKPLPFDGWYLQQPDTFAGHVKNDLIFAIPQTIYEDFIFLEKFLYIRNAGIYMGTIKGKDFLPSHDLALSNHISPFIPSVEVSYEDAITYLRSESIKVTTETRGWCLVKFESMNLGWIKIMDGRINNYFPKDWRILKQNA